METTSSVFTKTITWPDKDDLIPGTKTKTIRFAGEQYNIKVKSPNVKHKANLQNDARSRSANGTDNDPYLGSTVDSHVHP